MRARLLRLVVLCLCGAPALVAQAHDPPEVRRVLLDETGAPKVLVANRGLMFLGDEPQLMCNEALQLSTTQLPLVVQLDEGRLLAATALGLFETSDRACSWERQDVLDPSQSAASLAQDPDGALWLAASSGLYTSSDAGRSWERRWEAQAGDYVQDLLLAPKQVFALRARLDGQAVRYSVLASSDKGASWQEQPLSVHDDEQPSLLAADPVHVIAKAAPLDTSLRDRLLVSHDGGKSFDSPLSLYAIGAASFSDDGARAWIAAEEGLYLSTDQGQSFTRVGPGELLTCVLEHAGRVYTCGFFAGVSAELKGVAYSDDGGQTFQSVMLFREVKSELACSSESETARRCELPWSDWEAEQGVALIMDAGVSPVVTAKPRSSSGCSAVLPRQRCGLGALVMLAWVLLARQRGRSWVRRRRNSEEASSSGIPEARRTASPKIASPSKTIAINWISKRVSS